MSVHEAFLTKLRQRREHASKRQLRPSLGIHESRADDGGFRMGPQDPHQRVDRAGVLHFDRKALRKARRGGGEETEEIVQGVRMLQRRRPNDRPAARIRRLSQSHTGNMGPA